MKFIQKYGLLIILILSFLVFINSCGINASLTNTNKRIDVLQAKMDSLKLKNISQQQMIDLIKITPAWKSLRIQQLSVWEHKAISSYEVGSDTAK